MKNFNEDGPSKTITVGKMCSAWFRDWQKIGWFAKYFTQHAGGMLTSRIKAVGLLYITVSVGDNLPRTVAFLSCWIHRNDWQKTREMSVGWKTAMKSALRARLRYMSVSNFSLIAGMQAFWRSVDVLQMTLSSMSNGQSGQRVVFRARLKVP